MPKIKENKLNITLNIVARWLVGLVFLFSAFTKGVDPLGTSFKVQEYMTAWSIGNITFEWALPMADLLSVALICAEFVVGIMLIVGSFRRLTAWLLVLMMLFFTCTTFIDAITNKVTDCGCFGDAVKLTNWQTFWKNIILDVPAAWVFLSRNINYRPRFERDIIVMLSAIAVMIVFEMYNIKHEPIVDFRPWKVGNHMIDLDSTDEVASYVTYRNIATGKTEEFPSAELMAKMAQNGWTEQWEWESSRVVDPREIAAEGFVMLDLSNEDHSVDLLQNEDGLLIITAYHLDKVDQRGLKEIDAARHLAEESGIETVLLTSALPEEVQSWMADNNIENMDYFFADATAIKTMMRGNPGLMLIRRAQVVAKGRKAADLPL